jgi:phosphinothricin acetyltransferase
MPSSGLSIQSDLDAHAVHALPSLTALLKNQAIKYDISVIRDCTPQDAVQICTIYNHYVRETTITFEESPVAATEMASRIDGVISHHPWLVWETNAGILGYAYATPWKSRAAYRHSVEASVYLSPQAIGQGLGTQLYAALIAGLRRRGFHCVIGGAALPNPGSVALHEKLGFTKVAEFQEVGFKFGHWINVAYWELVL